MTAVAKVEASETAVRSYTAALFSLLRVRRQMREMGL